MTEQSGKYCLDWPYAYGGPQATGLFRQQLGDFCVDEALGFDPLGEGEHVYLHIEKRGDNTAWLARQIARLAEVQPMDVGYAGLKDRHGITRQWFSVYFPKGEEPQWQSLNSDSVTLLTVTRHTKKLRRGSHAGNDFRIRLRDLSGDLQGLSQRLAEVAQGGVPNYFGPQRFGHDGNNLLEAERLLVEGGKIKNRQKRGLILSAARSYLFNSVLSNRVASGSWKTLLEGEPLAVSNQQPSAILNQAPSAMLSEEASGTVEQERVDQILTTGPLWGRGRPLSSGECLALESELLSPLAAWRDGLEHVGLSQERRNLHLVPQGFSSSLLGDCLEVSFHLPPGAYATVVLRELLVLKDVSLSQDMV
ncbi:MAG: tRNA pseudouridine(13) synthase TruD [Cellvibrionaceae bacterium]|nr:tRNA pseudouridine(13) synthase TruD [Cellvibrionaceae bacterium]